MAGNVSTLMMMLMSVMMTRPSNYLYTDCNDECVVVVVVVADVYMMILFS